jgi:hypothetical protein
MAKSALPIILLGGGAAVLLMGGKKKRSSSGGSSGSSGGSSGSSGGSSGSSGGSSGSSGGGGIPSSKDWTAESNTLLPKGVTVNQVRERICFVWFPSGNGGIRGGVQRERDYINSDDYYFTTGYGTSGAVESGGGTSGDLFPVMGTKSGTLEEYYDLSLGKVSTGGSLGVKENLDPGSFDWGKIRNSYGKDRPTELNNVENWRPIFDSISSWLGSREHLPAKTRVMVNREIVRFMVYIVKKAIAVLSEDDENDFYSGNEWYCKGGGAKLPFSSEFSSNPYEG